MTSQVLDIIPWATFVEKVCHSEILICFIFVDNPSKDRASSLTTALILRHQRELRPSQPRITSSCTMTSDWTRMLPQRKRIRSETGRVQRIPTRQLVPVILMSMLSRVRRSQDKTYIATRESLNRSEDFPRPVARP